MPRSYEDLFYSSDQWDTEFLRSINYNKKAFNNKDLYSAVQVYLSRTPEVLYLSPKELYTSIFLPLCCVPHNFIL